MNGPAAHPTAAGVRSSADLDGLLRRMQTAADAGQRFINMTVTPCAAYN
jgi:hypothetical protein